MQIYAGVVREGKRRGTGLGFPTINIDLTGDESGIYAATVTIDDKEYMAAVFADPDRGILEAHILDFSHEIYGLPVTIRLSKKIRETAQYASDAELKAAIATDVESVRAHFSRG